MTAPHVSEDRIASFFPHIKNCSDVCLFHSELTENQHQGLTVIKINEHVYVFGLQWITNQTPNSWLTWLVQIRFLPLGNVDFSLPRQTPLPFLCLLPKFWISAIFSPHHYTAAKKTKQKESLLHAGSNGQGLRIISFLSHVFSCQTCS